MLAGKIGHYIHNVKRGSGWFLKSLIGRPVPQYERIVGDWNYFAPNQEVANKAIEILAVYYCT